MPHDVFISYSSQDKAVADAACAALEAEKIRCWIAPRDVLAGTEWANEIVKAIDGCRAMVLVFSANANRSRDIASEVHLAFSRGMPIVSLRIENVAPEGAMEYRLSRTHWLDALTPPLETRICELAGSVSRLLNRPDNTATIAAQPQSSALPESESQRFARMFTERPDVIAEVEVEASRTPAQTVAQFERLLIRLEVSCSAFPTPIWTIWTSPAERAFRERLLKLIGLHDSDLEEAKAFVAVSRRCDLMYGEWLKQATEGQRQSMHSISEQEREHQSGCLEWRQPLDSYQRSIGETGQIRNSIIALGSTVLPLVFVAFRQLTSFDRRDATSLKFAHSFRMEFELVRLMCRSKDFRALPFFAEAILRREDDMNGHNDWGLGIVRAFREFGMNRTTVDECFQRLIGVTGSEILRERRD